MIWRKDKDLILYFRAKKSVMVSLYLVRHGETIENVEQILQGLMPGHLSELGKQQAEGLATKLMGIPFSQMYVSDLNRTIETALILNEKLQLPMQTTPLLRERDWGTATGMKVAEVDRQNLPPSAETVEHMAERGAAFIHHLLTHHDGETILAVSHGLFSRCLQALVTKCLIRETPRMQNAEARILQIEQEVQPSNILGETGATAN